MFSREICEIFKNTYFEEHLRMTTFGRCCQGNLKLLFLNPGSINLLNWGVFCIPNILITDYVCVITETNEQSF